jgi:hypothetical protein
MTRHLYVVNVDESDSRAFRIRKSSEGYIVKCSPVFCLIERETVQLNANNLFVVSESLTLGGNDLIVPHSAANDFSSTYCNVIPPVQINLNAVVGKSSPRKL